MSSAPVRPGPADGVRPLAARGEPLLSFNQTAHLVLEWLAEVRSARQSAQRSARPSALPMVLGLAIEGHPNIRAIEDALNEIVRRHDVLRMSVPDPRRLPPAREAAIAAALGRDGIVHAGLFTPRIWPVASLSLSVETIPVTGAGEQTSHLEARIRQAIERPFDYTQPPLMRAALFTLDADRHTLVVVLHHLAADAWSVGVLRGELERLSRAVVSPDDRSTRWLRRRSSTASSRGRSVSSFIPSTSRWSPGGGRTRQRQAMRRSRRRTCRHHASPHRLMRSRRDFRAAVSIRRGSPPFARSANAVASPRTCSA